MRTDRLRRLPQFMILAVVALVSWDACFGSCSTVFDFNDVRLDPRLRVDDPDGDDTVSVTEPGRLRVALGGMEDAWQGGRGGAPFVLVRDSSRVSSIETHVDLAAGGGTTLRSIAGVILVDDGNVPEHPFELTLGIERMAGTSQVMLQTPGITLARRDIGEDAAFLKLDRGERSGRWRAWLRLREEAEWELLRRVRPEELAGGGTRGTLAAGLFAKTWGDTTPATIDFEYLRLGESHRAEPETDIVSLESLLFEMVDRDRRARFPSGKLAFVTRQASSYDRKSVGPDRPGWFANEDWSHFSGVEERDGRREWVMMDAEGPGCITRIWLGGGPPYGTLRLYLDGCDTPALAGNVEELLDGRALTGPPLNAIRARGRNLYLPIPYAKHCRVTYDGANSWETKRSEDQTWYAIGYRTYLDPTVEVESFSTERLQKAACLLEEIGRILLDPGKHVGPITDRQFKSRVLPPQGSVAIEMAGEMAVRRLSVRPVADDMATALADCVLHLEFDGERTAEIPIGHFFGSGVGHHPYRSWYRQVGCDGRMTCLFVMPFRRRVRAELTNRGAATVDVELDVAAGPWKWDDRSMIFHSRTRTETFAVEARRGRDWSFLMTRGRGVLIGDTLSIRNGSAMWWGEGDEKIWVDGEGFPSIFGTGTEDYYGYSFGDPAAFQAPFHAQPMGAGNTASARTTNTRSRALDVIPFTRSLRFDLEAWHWGSCEMEYVGTTYWYQVPRRAGRRPR